MADRVVGGEARPDLTARLAPLPPADQRIVARHFAAEVNRFVFGSWALVQAVLAVIVLACAWRLDGPARWLAAAAAVMVALQGLWLGPAIGALGRSLDFVPRPLPPDIGRTFGLLHGGYMLADLAKAGLLLAIAWMCRRPS